MTVRALEQAKEDFDFMKENTYTIVKGDTIWIQDKTSALSFIEVVERTGISETSLIVSDDRLIFENHRKTVHIQDEKGQPKKQIIVEIILTSMLTHKKMDYMI